MPDQRLSAPGRPRRDGEGPVAEGHLHQSGLNVAYWAFNATKPPFDKKEVRQALAMAIDRDAIFKDVYLGAGEKAKTLIPATMWAYDDDIADNALRPRKGQGDARRRRRDDAARHRPLVSAGARPYNPNGKRIGEMMQADLAKIGVNAKLVTYEWGEYRKRLANDEEMTGQYRLDRRQRRSRQFLLPARLPGRQAGRQQQPDKWCNAEFNDLLVKARTIADQAERAKLYHRMQEIEHDEAPALLIAHSVVYEATRAK